MHNLYIITYIIMHHYLACFCGEKWESPDEKKQFAIVKEMSFCFLVSLLMS